MILHPVSHLSPLKDVAAHGAFNLRSLAIRGGATAGAAAFDMGLSKTRLEGLAYGTVTSLMMNGALRLFAGTPKDIKRIPDDASKDQARDIMFDNIFKIIFGLCISTSVSLGAYTTAVFTLMTIYSKTALGMGYQSQYNEFFESCATYRLWGFYAFLGTVMTFNLGW
eukprot:CAMPEP_0183702404 /NCGR_PEP_ID=MMETSP0737-20130205/514_1 /TAXON_ID=385413 /ORGANISM="Thalassiosira miniscula, Strain CCMP1093" /LENGTH=166 /DNA_ID=CAMNT_0025929003 /DNA_START=53 /DNA_END=550 /DNA_ORIENTATION=-